MCVFHPMKDIGRHMSCVYQDVKAQWTGSLFQMTLSVCHHGMFTHLIFPFYPKSEKPRWEDDGIQMKRRGDERKGGGESLGWILEVFD